MRTIEWDSKPRTMLRFLKPGDRFAFETSPGRFGQGTLLAKVSLGHSAEIYPALVSDPADTSAWDDGAEPAFFEILDTYSLFDRRREGDWQRIATDAAVPSRPAHRSTRFGYGSPGDGQSTDLFGHRAPVDEHEFARLPRYRPAGHRAVVARLAAFTGARSD